MKTFFKSFAVLAGLTLLMAGCAQDEFLSQKDGGDAVVTFTAEFPSAPATKATFDNDGNAANVNRCIMEIYYDNTLFDRLYTKVDGKQATFTVTLVANRTYKVAFWADYVEDATTDEGRAIDKFYKTDSVGGLQNVALKGDYAGNDDKRDAFAYCADYTVEQGGSSFTAKLTRPFAQINVITTDVETVKKVTSLVPDKVDVTIKNAATCYNVLQSTAAGDTADLNYTASLYNWDADTTASTLSMDYIFAENTKSVIDIDWKAKHGDDADVAHTFSNIPYQRNYRTNIKGDLLTVNAQWTVTVDSAWTNDGTGEFEVIVLVANTLEEVQKLIDNNSGENKTVEIQIKDTVSNSITLSIPDNTTTPNWVFKIENMTSTGAIVVKDENPDNNDVNFKNSAEVVVPEGMTAEQVTFNTPKAHGIVSGDFGRIDASTGGSTLEVKAGSTVEAIYVHHGNVALYGEVDHIYRADDNTEEVVVNIYDGANWTAWNDEKSSTGIKPIVNVGTYTFDPTGYNVNGSIVTANDDATWTVSAQIKIGDNVYCTLNDALAEVQNGETIIVGKVTDTPASVGGIDNVKGKTFTIKGTDKELSIVKIGNGTNCGGDGYCDYRFTGANVTFENVTIAEYLKTGTSWYQGFVRVGDLTFKNCDFSEGTGCYWGNNCIIDGCTFNQEDAYEYPIYTWGCANMTVKNCTFNTQGKALKMYGAGTCVLNVENCTFYSNGKHDGADKPAIAINTLDYTTDYTLNITNCTQNGFIAGATGSAMFGSDKAAEVSGNLKVYLDGKLVWKDGVSFTYISSSEQLLEFAVAVNGGNTFSGKTVILENDIDLDGINWIPAGNVDGYPSITFAGTFDGQNHTIKNMTCSAEGNNATAGLFGSLTGKVKNLKMENVNVSSNHFAGAICGYSSSNVGMEICNCSVNGGTIKSTPVDGDNGDKAGGIIGYCVTGDKVDGCSVEGVTVTAFRDLGGIVGCSAATVTNNTVKNSTIRQDNKDGYTGSDTSTYHEIIGRDLGATVSGNTFADVTLESVN